MTIDLPKNPTIKNIHHLYHRKLATVQEVVNFFYGRIDQTDTEINAIVRRTEELARKKALKMDKILQEKSDFNSLKLKYPLFGIPFAIKDLILVEGQEITAQSKILENYISPFSSDVYLNLEKAGAILIATTNMDEYAFGSSTEYSGYGQITKNPFDNSRVPGGTSGGSAAAVASGQVPFALGSDTGGSIRQPSSFCNVVGLRPTYGLVSRHGIIPSASSLDQIGPISNNIEDNRTVLQIISQNTDKDQTKLDYTKDLLEVNDEEITVGVPKECFGPGLSKETKNRIEETLNLLRKGGYSIQEISLPSLDYALAVYYILQTVEASANLERYDGVRYGKQAEGEVFYATRSKNFGQEVTRRIMLGTYASSAGYYDAYYNKACQAREKIRREFEEAFDKVDLMIMPTSPFPAFRIGENSNEGNILAMYLVDVLTVPQPLAKIPSLNFPLGLSEYQGTKLPIGLQITGKSLREDSIYKLGATLEKLFTKDRLN
jgi:aspartyl-tRNA(Asn)/glutamyl-tRNA(Gln) amidotransferase subunit A